MSPCCCSKKIKSRLGAGMAGLASLPSLREARTEFKRKPWRNTIAASPTGSCLAQDHLCKEWCLPQWSGLSHINYQSNQLPTDISTVLTDLENASRTPFSRDSRQDKADNWNKINSTLAGAEVVQSLPSLYRTLTCLPSTGKTNKQINYSNHPRCHSKDGEHLGSKWGSVSKTFLVLFCFFQSFDSDM